MFKKTLLSLAVATITASTLSACAGGAAMTAVKTTVDRYCVTSEELRKLMRLKMYATTKPHVVFIVCDEGKKL